MMATSLVSVQHTSRPAETRQPASGFVLAFATRELPSPARSFALSNPWCLRKAS
jgi:hypothetical protein